MLYNWWADIIFCFSGLNVCICKSWFVNHYVNWKLFEKFVIQVVSWYLCCIFRACKEVLWKVCHTSGFVLLLTNFNFYRTVKATTKCHSHQQTVWRLEVFFPDGLYMSANGDNKLCKRSGDSIAEEEVFEENSDTSNEENNKENEDESMNTRKYPIVIHRHISQEGWGIVLFILFICEIIF